MRDDLREYVTEVVGADDFFRRACKLGLDRSCRISRKDCVGFWCEFVRIVQAGFPVSFVEALAMFVEWRFNHVCGNV